VKRGSNFTILLKAFSSPCFSLPLSSCLPLLLPLMLVLLLPLFFPYFFPHSFNNSQIPLFTQRRLVLPFGESERNWKHGPLHFHSWEEVIPPLCHSLG
jgi:hypothetical protein